MIVKCLFTTSWDDGSIFDLKLAELLAKYNIKGTFYIPIKNSERNDSLEPKQIREISKLFEIGGHTFSHVVLTEVDYHTAKKEIEKGKMILEDIIQKNIVGFCPPRGKFKKRYINLIHSAGFEYIRTTGYLRTKRITEKCGNIILLHTTLQFFSHKPFTYVLSAIKRRDWEGLLKIYKNISNPTFYKLLQSIFKEVISSGGVFHLWGHSWEIEEYDLWKDLENFLKYVTEFENLQFLTNYEVVKEYAVR